MDRIGNKYIGYGICTILIFLLLFSMTMTVRAEPATKILNKNDTNNTYQHKQGDTCSDCHNSSHVQQVRSKQVIKKQQADVKQTGAGKVSPTINTLSTRVATTTVVGNITLISSMGQDWFQQGIYGINDSGTTFANDKSWGWTFFDENPPSEYIIPSDKVIQRDNIFALLLDDGNNSILITGATVTADVTYWTYDEGTTGWTYTSNIKSIPLTEDVNRKGFYSGRFDFYGGTTYGGSNMQGCDGCHPFWVPDTLTGYFPGNYSVTVSANADGKTKTKDLSFDVTAWGCEDCHNSGNQHSTRWLGMDSACYLCHSINDITGMGDAGNPHQNTAHRNINCVDCHTNKGINSQTFNGVTFTNGGFRNGPTPQYVYDTIALNKGKHLNLVCGDCHGNLVLGDVGGGYNAGRYTINDKINKYDPNFASVQQFLDYYVIDVAGGGSLDISFNWEGTSNLGFYLYPPNFNPINRTGSPYYNGATFTNKPESYSNGAPMTGKWILQIYGYNLRSDWIGELQSPINYTISSTYPLEKKGLPLTPECNTCHNSGATGGTYTKDNIPNWNPGYAHVDTNGDGSLDIQCRMCHDSTHNIGVKKCQDCHTTAPTGHAIVEPKFSQYTTSQCLMCHGDPHKVSSQAEQCIQCHGTNYPGAVPSSTMLVDISLFNGSIHQNINKSVPSGDVTDNDCWMCHYNVDMNRQNVRKCGYCHSKTSQWHGNTTGITTNLTTLAQK